MNKAYIKSCLDLEDECGKAAYATEKKSMKELDDFIKNLHKKFLWVERIIIKTFFLWYKNIDIQLKYNYFWVKLQQVLVILGDGFPNDFSYP